MRWRTVVAACTLILIAPASGASWQAEGDWNGSTVHGDAGNVTFSASVDQHGRVAIVANTSLDRVAMTVRPTAIVEYQDLDRDAEFGLGDPVVQRVAFDSLWPRTIQDDDGLHVHWAIPASTRGTVDLHLLPGAQQGDLMTTQWQVWEFPFQSDNQTRLALEVRVVGAAAFAPDALEVRNGSLGLAWGWSGTPAHVTLIPYATEAGEETIVAFHVPRGQEFDINTTWRADEAPAELEEASILQRLRVGDPRLFFFAASVAALALAGSAYRVIKRER